MQSIEVSLKNRAGQKRVGSSWKCWKANGEAAQMQSMQLQCSLLFSKVPGTWAYNAKAHMVTPKKLILNFKSSKDNIQNLKNKNTTLGATILI